jgi:hypothetical protein
MKGFLVDSNVILDIFLDDPKWGDWSLAVLSDAASDSALYINQIVYAEVSIGFKKIEELESALHAGGFQMLEIPKEALFLAGKAYLNYRRSKGTKRSPLPDFYIGAQAAVLGIDLITRDETRYKTYFPSINILCPER